MDGQIIALQARLQHRFTDPQLLARALTHRSFSADHNERLEFLGDSVLNLAVAALLYDRLKALPEGDLSRGRANLVKQETLHQLAVGLGLPDVIRLGEGESRSGGSRRPSILADALEAVIGAVHLDAGYSAAEALVHHQRHAEPARGLQDGGHPGEDDGVPDRLPEDWVVVQLDEIAEAHEGGSARHLLLEEAQVHAIDERIAEEGEQEQHGRREHEPGKDGFALQERAEPAEPDRPMGGRRESARPRGLEDLAQCLPLLNVYP